MKRFLPLCLILMVVGCATPSQTTVSVKPVAIVAHKALQSVIAPPGSITLVPKDVILQWTASENTDTETVSGYNLYYATETRFDNDGTWPSNYSNVISAGNVTNLPVTGLRGDSTYYFALTALDQDDVESDFSAEAIYTTPFVMDLIFAFDQPVTNVVLQASPDLIHWQDVGTIPTNGTWRITADTTLPGVIFRSTATTIP